MMKRYTADLQDKNVRKLYDAYMKKKGIPVWCPLSDAERDEFDHIVIMLTHRQEIRNLGRKRKDE